MAFGAIEEAGEQARPSFFAACQNPLTKPLMPVGMVRLTYNTACRWSGIRQKCSTCTSGWYFGMLSRQSTSAFPSDVRLTLALPGSLSGTSSQPNRGLRSGIVSVMWYRPTPFHVVPGSCHFHFSCSAICSRFCHLLFLLSHPFPFCHLLTVAINLSHATCSSISWTIFSFSAVTEKSRPR